ncbi:hypothetical protein [Rhodopirellula baltica]|uniref:Uncharacterized protein n=1 Tax=Rhodopirellula baltica SWK14 TaxID=993516 RepID=L7CKY3_RHOBT|nr:hypothetical protein [Rhodopirellula baltica]ELP34643.1 hypothetical protein RBSWK_01430 [Rhodopirellula baltica SWK14]
MFDRSKIHAALNRYDDALPRDDVLPMGEEGPNTVASAVRLKRRKPFGEVMKFLLLIVTVGPLLFVLCLAVAAQGIREMVSVMRTRLYQLPLPGIEKLSEYQGFADLDLSHVASALLFLAVTFIWVRVISEFKGLGPVMGYRQSNPFAFWLYTLIAGVILVTDALVFWAGLAAKNSGWNDTPAYVPIACTLLYAAGLAAFGALHQSYHQPDQV